MSDLVKRFDFWLTIGSIVFFVWLEIDKFRAWWGGRSVKRSWHIDPNIMSRSAGSTTDRTGSGTGSDRPVPTQQHQAAPELVPTFDAVIAFLAKHNLDTPEQLIDVLAVLHYDGEYPISANKIRDLAGGNEAAVKARVAKHRPKQNPPKPSPRLERPINGW